MIKHAITTAFLVIALGVSGSSALDRHTIRIASEGASPPWTSIDDNGQLVGFDIDVGRELCNRMNMECDFVAQDWDGIIPSLSVGKYDAIMSGMSITEKRKQSIAFSIPYGGGFNQFVVKKDLGLPQTDTSAALNLSAMDDAKEAILDKLESALTGKTLGVLRSSNSEAVLNQLFGKVASIRSYDSQDNMHLDLVAGRIDGGLADYFAWQTFLATPDGAMSTFYGPKLSGGLWGPGVGVGIRKDDVDLVHAFDAAIAMTKADGTLKHLSLKWFGIDVSPAP